jgi:hypothetical protein
MVSPPLPSFASPKPVSDPPINWCGRCSRRFRGFGTLCPQCVEIERAKPKPEPAAEAQARKEPYRDLKRPTVRPIR